MIPRFYAAWKVTPWYCAIIGVWAGKLAVTGLGAVPKVIGVGKVGRSVDADGGCGSATRALVGAHGRSAGLRTSGRILGEGRLSTTRPVVWTARRDTTGPLRLPAEGRSVRVGISYGLRRAIAPLRTRHRPREQDRGKPPFGYTGTRP